MALVGKLATRFQEAIGEELRLLVQEMVYACNLGEEDECRKKEILVVSDQLVPEEVAL